MQQSVKRLIIIVLIVISVSIINFQTASAQAGIQSNRVSTYSPFGNILFASVSFSLIKANAFFDVSGESLCAPFAQNTPVPLATVITNTPDDDGIIIHKVKYGETLFTIAEAYGVPIDQILSNSGLSLTTTDIREGQILVIRKATDPTATPSPTATFDPGTPTPTQVRPTRTPFPTRTPAPTRTPTEPPSLLHRALGDAKNVGVGLILMSGLGILVVIYLGFLKKS